MDDRTLLELAARAAGISASWDVSGNEDLQAEMEGMFLNGDRSPDNDKYWNPLRVDGDALRLAVKLKMLVDIETRMTAVIISPTETGSLMVHLHEMHGDDPDAATRRAIVRAAAAIGEGMG